MPKISNKFKILLLAVFISLALALVLLPKLREKADQKKPLSVAAIPTPVVLTEGSFTLNAVPTSSPNNSDKTKELSLIASSNNKSIVAYDVILQYEKGSLEILSVESLIPDFDIYPLEKSDHFIITGAKKIESNRALVFDETPILRVKILPKKAGNIDLKIVENAGKEKTQMVDDKSTILSPEVSELKLESK